MVFFLFCFVLFFLFSKIVANPVICADLRKRARRWGSRRPSAFLGELPEGQPVPFPPSRGRAVAARSGALGGGGARRRRDAAPASAPAPSLPFPSRPAAAAAAAGESPRHGQHRVPRVDSRRPEATAGRLWEDRAGGLGWAALPAHEAAGRGGEERSEPGIAAGARRMSPLFSWVAKVGGAAPAVLRSRERKVQPKSLQMSAFN